MQLFKRVLLSLFPDEMMANNLNPASMFISFISAKEFFSVINRKIVENYKLNLFDIAIDPFEFKIWFWKNTNIKQKDIDLYYGYCGTANINGYRFFNPSNVANCTTLVACTYLKDIFRGYPEQYFINFLYTIYLLSFVFLARIKIFPYEKKEQNYNWMIDIIFSFYHFVFEQTAKTINEKHVQEIKKNLLWEIELLFFLFEYYQNLNNLFYNEKISPNEFYERVFYDEIRNNSIKNVFISFIEQQQEYTSKTSFSLIERKVLHYILPADILIKYLFLDADTFSITDTIISHIYEKKVLDSFLKEFPKGKWNMKEMLLYITDYRNLKKNFFKGVQKYLVHIFREEGGNKIDENLDDLMSSIGEDMENPESFQVPERIKKESKIMEKILNFYITLIGWLWISRGDNFYIRLCKKGLIQEIVDQTDLIEDKKDSIYYYGSLLYNYGKNIFFYKYAAENIRSGKQKFYLPYQTDSKKIYSNMCIIRLFDENFLSTLLQDINTKDIRLYVKNQKILEIFKKRFGKEISNLVKEKKNGLIEYMYQDIQDALGEIKWFTKIIQKYVDSEDVFHIKDNIYSLDFWLSKSLHEKIKNLNLQKSYGDQTILWILATTRETMMGFLLYIKFIEQKNESEKTNIEILRKTYCKDIIGINQDFYFDFKDIIKEISKEFSELLGHWIEMDDNKDFFTIGRNNRKVFAKNVNNTQYFSGEDVIRFKGYIKNITYYNKRFLIPKGK